MDSLKLYQKELKQNDQDLKQNDPYKLTDSKEQYEL
jgi:hypothetical protein